MLGGTYLVIYFFHLVAFFSSRNSVKLQNRRRGITEGLLLSLCRLKSHVIQLT